MGPCRDKLKCTQPTSNYYYLCFAHGFEEDNRVRVRVRVPIGSGGVRGESFLLHDVSAGRKMM